MKKQSSNEEMQEWINIIMKRLLLVFSVLLLWLPSESQMPAPNIMIQVANRFMTDNFPGGEREISTCRIITEDSVETFCIMNLEPEGWLLLSYDMRVIPVLGFSYTGKFIMPPEDKDNPVYLWMENYNEQIKMVRSRKGSVVVSGWDLNNNIIEAEQDESTRLRVDNLIDMTWGQGETYNQFCPADPDGPGGHVYVGCVAVSMAQAMSVYKRPQKGYASHSYFTDSYGIQYVNFAEAIYKWDSMSVNDPDRYNALLLYHCAVSVDMEFGAGSSGTLTVNTVYALKKYFNYSRDITYRIRVSDDQQWMEMLNDQLRLGKPIIYSGDADDGNAGHAFNIDGVINGYYHINWGWNGTGNGYYSINSLAPGSHDYTENHLAVMGIKPYYYPTGIEICDTIVPENVPPGFIVGIINVIDEADDNSYSYTLTADSVFAGNNWIMDYYLDGDSLKTGRIFTGEDERTDTIWLSVTDSYGNFLEKEIILRIGIPATGIFTPDNESSSMITLFPNPAKDYISIKKDRDSEITCLYIFDIQGTLISRIEEPVSCSNIDISVLKQGYYVLGAEYEDHEITCTRFIKR